jgi:hypothetical protein
MTLTISNNPLDKVLSVIQNLGEATVTEIKRKIAEYNQGGGVEKLRNVLSELVSNGSLNVRTKQSGNGQSVEVYRLTNSNVSSNGNAGNGNNGSNLKITVTVDIAFEGLEDMLSLLFTPTNMDTICSNGGNDGSNECNTEEESASHDIEVEEVPLLVEKPATPLHTRGTQQVAATRSNPAPRSTQYSPSSRSSRNYTPPVEEEQEEYLCNDAPW